MATVYHVGLLVKSVNHASPDLASFQPPAADSDVTWLRKLAVPSWSLIRDPDQYAESVYLPIVNCHVALNVVHATEDL